MTSWRVRLRRLRLGIQTLIATIVIVATLLVVGVMQLVVLPWLGSHPESISAFLGERLHRPVRVDQVVAGLRSVTGHCSISKAHRCRRAGPTGFADRARWSENQSVRLEKVTRAGTNSGSTDWT